MKRTATDDANHSSAKRSKHADFVTSPTFFSSLIQTKVDAPRTDEGKIFFCRREDKMVDVWKGMVKHNFLSVPVIQKTKNKYYGFVDLADIVTYVITKFSETQLTEAEDWWELVSKSEEMQATTINEIMTRPLTRRNPFHPIPTGFSLFSAVELLARERGLHHVPVVTENEERRLVNIITQSQMMQYVAQNIDQLGDRAKMPVSSMSYSRDVYTVHEDEQAIQAFRLMVENKISGIAVTRDGKITGNISLRDLKGIHHDARVFWRLFQPVHQFLAKVGEEFQANHGRPKGLVSVTESDSLRNVVERMADNHVHRVWVVDAHQSPIGVISIKDVLYDIIESSPSSSSIANDSSTSDSSTA